MYYTTFPIQEQAIRGSWDFSLTHIYFIGLLNFEVNEFRNTPNYLHHGQIMDIKTKEVMYDKLNMIYVEIPKLQKEKEELSNHLEWWLYTFQHLSQLQEIPNIIEKAFDRAEFIKLPKAEQDKYHKNLKVYRDLINSLDTAHEKGLQKGLKRGEKIKAIEIAKNLLDVLDVETIALKTGLSVDEIKGLKY